MAVDALHNVSARARRVRSFGESIVIVESLGRAEVENERNKNSKYSDRDTLHI